MVDGYDGAEEAIGTYFEGVVYDIKDHSITVARPSNVIEETKQKEQSIGATIGSVVSSIGGEAFDDLVMSAARQTVDDVATDVIREQRDIVFEATQLKAGEEADTAAYERKKEQFATYADNWVDDLNRDARQELNRAMRDGFDTVTDNLAYFVEANEEFDGQSFEELIASTPREESEERLYSLVDYVTGLKEAFQKCDQVYSSQDNPMGDRIHFKHEATRVLDEVETYVEDEIEDTLDRAYGDAQ